MTELTSVRLRASLAPTWLACPSRATFKALEDRERATNGTPVALAFGEMVHESVTGHSPTSGEWPISFDEHTPTARALAWQSDMAIEKARSVLAGMEVVRREEELSVFVNMDVLQVSVMVTGTIDLVVLNDDGTIDLLDLKTGRLDQREAFAQMAIYAWLADQEGWKVRDVVLLHVPRATQDITGEQVFELLRRPCKPLIEEATATIRLVGLSASSPVSVPGLHCKRCPNTDCIYNPENDGGKRS